LRADRPPQVADALTLAAEPPRVNEGFVKAKPNWRLTVYPTGARPHFELPTALVVDFDALLADAG